MAKNFAIWSLPPVTIVHGVPHAEFIESIDVRGDDQCDIRDRCNQATQT
jgi:hypothetical protein